MADIDQAALAEVVAGLNDLQARALEELTSEYGQGPRHLAANLNISEKEARQVLKGFRRDGICDFGPLSDEETGELRGSGYWLGRFGRAVQQKVFAALSSAPAAEGEAG